MTPHFCPGAADETQAAHSPPQRSPEAQAIATPALVMGTLRRVASQGDSVTVTPTWATRCSMGRGAPLGAAVGRDSLLRAPVHRGVSAPAVNAAEPDSQWSEEGQDRLTEPCSFHHESPPSRRHPPSF